MILSVSRRTDIPAFYSEWFFNRLREGYALVRHPMFPHRLSRVAITPGTVECIVFWTKDPSPMLGRLDELEEYGYYFEFTVNPYGRDLERGVPRKRQAVDTFRRLADKIGPERVIWRYDPILLSDTIGVEYHMNYFDRLAERLEGYTRRCMVSFIDPYRKTERNLAGTSVRILQPQEMERIAAHIAESARDRGIEMCSCAERIGLEGLGIAHGECIDAGLIEKLAGRESGLRKDRNQRPECGCAESVDIGEYDTCLHHCLYCYANFSAGRVAEKAGRHDPVSPLLSGQVGEGDVIRERTVRLASRRRREQK